MEERRRELIEKMEVRAWVLLGDDAVWWKRRGVVVDRRNSSEQQRRKGAVAWAWQSKGTSAGFWANTSTGSGFDWAEYDAGCAVADGEEWNGVGLEVQR